jgi:hypothetical protein
MHKNMSEHSEIKNITLDELAIMMNTSFVNLKKDLEEKIDDFKAETKSEFKEVHERLDRIENVLIRDDRKRIDRLEDKLLQVEVILGKKL